MTHVPDGLNDKFSHNVTIAENCTAKKFYGDASGLTNIPSVAEQDPIFVAASAALNSHIADATIHFTSNSLWASIANVQDIAFGASSSLATHIGDNTVHFTSASLWASIANVQDVAYLASSALVAHAGDSSDPHGATLTQTTINAGTATITADNDTASTAIVRNFVIDSASAAHVASSYTQGTVLLIYT